MGRRGLGKDTTNKKKKEDKIEQGNQIRENIQKYERIYVLRFSSAVTEHQADIRRRFRSSTLCMAKRSIIGHAIGLTPETSVLPEIYKLNEYLSQGEFTGLFMTNEPHEEVMAFLNSLACEEFANCGFIATDTITIPAGPLEQFSFDMDSYLRELGLPVQLDNGVIMNVRDYTICNTGEPLTKNAARLLKHFNVKMAYFTASAIALWQQGQVLTPQ